MIAAGADSKVLKSVTVLKLKLTDEHNKRLDEIGELCRKARNEGVLDWLLRQHGKPESERQAKRLVSRRGAADDKPKSESTKLYHGIAEKNPQLHTQAVAIMAGAINSQLGAKVDWRRGKTEDGKRPRRRDEILAFAERPPFTTSIEIPLHNKHARVDYGDKLVLVADGILKGMAPLRMEICSQGLPRGYKRLLFELAQETRKLPVSKLVRKEDAWYWHVPVEFKTERRSEIEAILAPIVTKKGDAPVRGAADRFFALTLPGWDRPWFVGDGRYLLAQTQRLIGLRKRIGKRYRDRQKTGHGRAKIDAMIRRRRRQEADVRAEVRRMAIADVVRQCVKANVGTLHYREPSLPLREKCWFARVGLEFDWTRFGADLANACRRQGIEVIVDRMKMKDAS